MASTNKIDQQVAVAAAQERGLDGATALRGMLLSDEIRGRLAEVDLLSESSS